MPSPHDHELQDVRIDRWLLAARAFKTRPLAQAACRGSKVTIDNQSAEPDRAVRRGQVVGIRTPQGLRLWRVVDLGTRRGSPLEARLLYDDETPPEAAAPVSPSNVRTEGTGRPTKRDRRHLDRLRLR